MCVCVSVCVCASARACVHAYVHAHFRFPQRCKSIAKDTAALPPLPLLLPPSSATFPPQALLDMGPPGGVVPTPTQTFVTRWGQDPYARGSYSYYATGNRRVIVGEGVLHAGRDMLGRAGRRMHPLNRTRHIPVSTMEIHVVQAWSQTWTFKSRYQIPDSYIPAASHR